MSEWLETNAIAAAMVALSTVGIYATTIAAIRIVGLRSLSKMSGFDFVSTVAIGSAMSGILLNKNPPLLLGIIGMGCIFTTQFGIAWLRRHLTAFSRLVDNEPVFLMIGPNILHENLAGSRMTEYDLMAKLREANVLNFGQVHAVVLETTGDISVLHSEGGDSLFDPAVLGGVREKDRYAADVPGTQSS